MIFFFFLPSVKRAFRLPQAVVMASDLPHTASTLLLIKADQRRLARSQSPVMRPDVSSDKAPTLSDSHEVGYKSLSQQTHLLHAVHLNESGTPVFVRRCIPSWFFPPAFGEKPAGFCVFVRPSRHCVIMVMQHTGTVVIMQ